MADTVPLPTKVEIWQSSDGISHPTQLAAYVRSAALLLVEAVEDGAAMPPVVALETLLTEHRDALWEVVNLVKHMADGRDPERARIP